MAISSQWLLLFILAYCLVTLYWAVKSGVLNRAHSGFYTASGTLPSWMTAVGISGASISGWVVLGFPQAIASQGLAFSVMALAGIVIPLTGVLFFMPQWALAKRYQLHSQGALFNTYYGGKMLGIASALVAVLLAIGFVGVQLRAVSILLASLSGHPDQYPLFIWGIASFLCAYLVIGGMRAAGFLSVIQTVLLGLSVSCLGIFALSASGGFTNLNEALAIAAEDTALVAKGMFQVAGVIQFNEGIGTGNPIGGQWTAMMIFSSVLGLMGIQASPMMTHMVLASRDSRAIAAGQTWIMAAFFGALIVLFVVVIGVAGFGRDIMILESLLAALSMQSPWFTAMIAIGLIAAVQVVAGIALLSASSGLIRDIYKPVFHSGLSDQDQVLYGKVSIVIMLVVCAMLASFPPVAISWIGSVSLPIAAQLWPALLGLCWFGFMSRQAIVAGLYVGIIAVLATDNLGIGILEFLGLDVPWGRWPWTIHSTAWGMIVNLVAVIVISAITQGRGHSKAAPEIRKFLRARVRAPIAGRSLKPAAWSAVLAWMFLAVGPGVILGNQVFGRQVRTTQTGCSACRRYGRGQSCFGSLAFS